jgi:hypothetical protein
MATSSLFILRSICCSLRPPWDAAALLRNNVQAQALQQQRSTAAPQYPKSYEASLAKQGRSAPALHRAPST